MILENGEELVGRGNAEARFEDAHSEGILHLTSRRLVYEEHTWGGRFRPGSIETLVDVPLSAIRNVNTVEGTRGEPQLHLEFFTPYPRTIRFQVAEPARWRDSIVRARLEATAGAPPPTPPISTPTPQTAIPTVIVNIAPAPLPVVMFPCRHCGVPQASHLAKCTSCGAPLRP